MHKGLYVYIMWIPVSQEQVDVKDLMFLGWSSFSSVADVTIFGVACWTSIIFTRIELVQFMYFVFT